MTSITKDGKIEFRFYRPRVRQVSVVGDFNGWRRDALRMQPSGEGWWRAEAQLQGGDYRFRYLADDTWFTDYASNGIEVGRLGCNSLLTVPESKDTQATYDASRHVA